MIILTDENRTAQKTHRCEWCGERIEKGEKYHYYSGPHDGRFQSTCMHEECFYRMQEEANHWGPDDFEFSPRLNERP